MCHRSHPLPTHCQQRHHQTMIQGCQINGAAGPSVKGHSWPHFCPPCRHLPCRHLHHCYLPLHPLGPPCSCHRSRQWRKSQSNQQSNHRWQYPLLLDELNIGGGLWDEAGEGLLGDLMGVCCSGGSQCKINGVITINGRWRDCDGCWQHERLMDGGGTNDQWMVVARTID